MQSYAKRRTVAVTLSVRPFVTLYILSLQSSHIILVYKITNSRYEISIDVINNAIVQRRLGIKN